MTTIHTRQLTTIHTRQLQQYTQDKYNNKHKTNNNTHKTTTTIHTRQLTTTHTIHLKIQYVQKVNSTKVRKYCIKFLVFLPTHIVLTLSPQPFTSHHLTTHKNISRKVSFSPLPYTAFHFTSLHFTTHLDDFHFILLRFSTLLDDYNGLLQSYLTNILCTSVPCIF